MAWVEQETPSGMHRPSPDLPARVVTDPVRGRLDLAPRSPDPACRPASLPENHREKVWRWRSTRERERGGGSGYGGHLFLGHRGPPPPHTGGRQRWPEGRHGGGGPRGTEVVTPESPLGSSGAGAGDNLMIRTRITIARGYPGRLRLAMHHLVGP